MGLWDSGWKLTTDLGPIIKSSSNLGALSSFLPSQSFKCLLPMLLLFLSPVPCKILFQNVSQPSANGIRSCFTITKPPVPQPSGPHYHPVSQDDLQPPWHKKTFQSSFINGETRLLFFQGTKKRKCYEQGNCWWVTGWDTEIWTLNN